MRVWGGQNADFFNFQSVIASKIISAFYLQSFMSFTNFLVNFACHVPKSSLRALKKKNLSR